MLTREADLTACCVATYGNPLVRWLLGGSFHPGGLELTTDIARIMEIDSGSVVLDAGCASGDSAVHLARTTGCLVTGVTLEPSGVEAARHLARRRGVQDKATFIQGDIQQADLAVDAFDAVLMECVLSILPQKGEALRRLHQVLRPGGRLGLSDVTVSGPLPAHLQGVLSIAGCTGDARSLDEYVALAQAQGFVVEHRQDLRGTAEAFLRDLKGKLMMAEVASKLGKLPVDNQTLSAAKGTLTEVQALVHQETLGYGLMVARKPG
ncbi:MAG: methyltransferase domain-containing protein [Chloroflexi bacterium]|nr:methyltransferase domain-containing protein [Chloroflexota bacterium]